MEDNYFSFANDLLKQEVVLQMGGFYADVTLEQKIDLEPYFKHYEGFFFSGPWNKMIDTVFAARKDFLIIKKSLSLKNSFQTY